MLCQMLFGIAGSILFEADFVNCGSSPPPCFFDNVYSRKCELARKNLLLTPLIQCQYIASGLFCCHLVSAKCRVATLEDLLPLSVVWAMNSIITSRLHLRVEGLRLWGAQQSFLVL